MWLWAGLGMMKIDNVEDTLGPGNEYGHASQAGEIHGHAGTGPGHHRYGLPVP
jgi:hypothetical protein